MNISTADLRTPKPVASSRATMNQIVLPNDANNLGNLMGGRLLHMMDVCAAISASRHAEQAVVTASVDSVEFQSAIYMSEIVVLEAQVNRAFRTSMEVEINVWAENPRARTRRKCNRAFYTFVAVDDKGQPIHVPGLAPETDEEHERYQSAARRRELRLLMAGRLRLEDAHLIKELVMSAVDPEDAPAEA
jgi:acyl-CoA hydrolase